MGIWGLVGLELLEDLVEEEEEEEVLLEEAQVEELRLMANLLPSLRN